MRKCKLGNFNKNKFFFLAGICCIALAVYSLVSMEREYRRGNRVYQKLKDAAVEEDEQNRKKDMFDYRNVTIDFDKLKQINEDIIGWIRFDQNGISYPLLLGESNEEYLYQTADGTKNNAGSIFLDVLCSADFTDSHTIIYGHNMRNLSMFGKLKFYRTEAGYYEKNRYFTIYTPDMIYRYEIFSWYEAAPDDGVYRVGFTANQTFREFVNSMKKRSAQETDVTVDKNDKIVTLSTCSTTGKRFVVHGKRIASVKQTKSGKRN